MRRHHEIEFAQMIDKLYSDGAVTVRWDHLYLWFGTERITKSVWQRIYQAFADLSTELHPTVEVPTLWVYKHPNSMTLVREIYKADGASMLTADGEASYTHR
jgi:hypothetical protein